MTNGISSTSGHGPGGVHVQNQDISIASTTTTTTSTAFWVCDAEHAIAVSSLHSLFFSLRRKVIYHACRACVSYDASNHRQRFNLDHTDNICSFAIHPSGRLAATGEVGKSVADAVQINNAGCHVGGLIWLLRRALHRVQAANHVSTFGALLGGWVEGFTPLRARHFATFGALVGGWVKGFTSLRAGVAMIVQAVIGRPKTLYPRVQSRDGQSVPGFSPDLSRLQHPTTPDVLLTRRHK